MTLLTLLIGYAILVVVLGYFTALCFGIYGDPKSTEEDGLHSRTSKRGR